MLTVLFFATLSGVAPAYAQTYETLLRQQQATEAANRFQQEVQTHMNLRNRLNSKVITLADRFAARHGGYAAGPTATYTNVRENFFDNEAYKEDRAFAYVVDHGPGLVDKIDFTTNDRLVCQALIYGVDCIHQTTGKKISFKPDTLPKRRR